MLQLVISAQRKRVQLGGVTGWWVSGGQDLTAPPPLGWPPYPGLLCCTRHYPALAC